MTLKYPVILIQDKEIGGFTIQFYDIPAAITQGETWAEALSEGSLLINETLEFNHFEQNRAVPFPSSVDNITLEEINSYFPWLNLQGNAKDYLDYVEFSEELSQKILEHNKKVCLFVA
jgi:predicted RNase H-like HicB family nuclease